MIQDTRLVMSNKASNIPNNLIGDRGRLEQVLVILVKYALKFSSDNFIKIKPIYDASREEFTVELKAKRSDKSRESLFVFKGIESFLPQIVEEGANIRDLALILAKKILT